MPTTKKNHGHENDSSRKGENLKSKMGKPQNEKGRMERGKGGEPMNPNRDGNQANR